MTQAVTNYDILNNLKMSSGKKTVQDSVDKNTAYTDNKSLPDSFDKIYEKSTDTEKYTTTEVSEEFTDRDMQEKQESLKDTLLQAAREVNMEKALDLTLARDITEIIGQLQAAVRAEFNLTDAANADGTVYSEAATEEAAAVLKDIKPDIKSDITDSALDISEDMLEELNIESISSETDFAGEDSAFPKESPEEFGVKVMLNETSEKFDLNPTNSSTNSAKPTEISSEKIIEQITKQLDSMKLNSRVNITLNPDSLGKINLQILNSKDGLSAQFTVMTNDIKDLLMKGLDGLKDALLAQGVTVDNISVKISEAEEAYNPDWTEQENSEGGNKGQEKQREEEKEKGLFERTMAESLSNDNKGKV